MIINCYYYLPHAHSLLGEHIETDLERMCKMGVDAVSVCVEESHLLTHTPWGWNRIRLQNFIAAAHRRELKVHALPNQWAGLTAGWTTAYPHFMLEHPETLSQRPAGEQPREQLVCCVNQPLVRTHFERSIDRLFGMYPFDGFIWDEPHAWACHCPECRRLAGSESPALVWYLDRFGRFVDDLSARIRGHNPRAQISGFVQPGERALLSALLQCTHLDFVGSDGHVRRPDYRMHRMKGTIFTAHAEFQPLIAAAGRRSLFLMEAQRHRDEDLPHYLEAMPEAFALPVDHFMFYYSAHEMSHANERIFNEATWAAVKAVRARNPRALSPISTSPGATAQRALAPAAAAPAPA